VQDNVIFDTRVFDGYVEGDGNVVHGDITRNDEAGVFLVGNNNRGEQPTASTRRVLASSTMARVTAC
jgi:hypothetical protein